MPQLISLCLVLIFAGQAVAQSEGDDTKLLTQQIRIVDEQGHPVEGAEARTGLINERYMVSIKGLQKKMTSNQDGVCDILYPEMSFPVESVTAMISHPDFCSAQSVVPINPNSGQPHEVKLKRGIKLTICAVDKDGEPTKSPFGILISGRDSAVLWHRPEPHLAICSSLTSGNRQIMLVQQTSDGRRLFSDVLTQQFNQEKEPAVRLEDVELRPGVPIRGKLDVKVARPVKNGIVIACQAPLPAGNAWEEALPSVMYHDWVEVEEDGSFEFPSMPETGTIQLIGYCEGWTGASEGSRVMGEEFEMESGMQDITLKMVPTFSVNIKVVDKEGQAVADAQCSFSPNQGWFKDGSTRLAAKHRSVAYALELLKQNSNANESKSKDNDSFGVSFRRFSAFSDQDGKMTVHHLPRNRGSQRISIFIPSPEANNGMVTIDKQIDLPAEDENQVDVEVVVD